MRFQTGDTYSLVLKTKKRIYQEMDEGNVLLLPRYSVVGRSFRSPIQTVTVFTPDKSSSKAERDDHDMSTFAKTILINYFASPTHQDRIGRHHLVEVTEPMIKDYGDNLGQLAHMRHTMLTMKDRAITYKNTGNMRFGEIDLALLESELELQWSEIEKTIRDLSK